MTAREHPMERVLALLKEAADLQRAGHPVDPILRDLGISEETYLEWRGQEGAEHSDVDEVIKELRREIVQLHDVLENLSLSAGISNASSGGDFQ